MSAAERSIQPVDCPTIDLDADMGGWSREKEIVVWVLKALALGEKTRGWQVNESGFRLAESSA